MSRRPSRSVAELFEAARRDDRAALARLISLIEQGDDDAHAIGRLAHPLGGSAYTIGITGAPGAGKSTLTAALITHLRRRDTAVAVLAIDPTSPFTGGAILGDRVRMQEHATDPGVFIRSMATRGHLGGLSLATPEAVRLLDAVGHRLVIVETVGVGQVEVDIAGTADTTVVVVNPGWGDSVQANKAGLLEVADVFVINKADRAGVDETRRDLASMLDMTDARTDAWRPPIVATVSTDGGVGPIDRGRPRGRNEGGQINRGVADVWEAVLAHRAHVEASGALAGRRGARLRDELQQIVAARLGRRARQLCAGERWEHIATAVTERQIDPWTAADEMLAGVDA